MPLDEGKHCASSPPPDIIATDLHLTRTCRTVHRYLGFVSGAVVCLLGLTGSVLVFRPELERLVRPELFEVRAQGPRADMRELRTIASPSQAGLELYRVRLPGNELSSYEFIFGKAGRFKEHVYVDPYERRLLGTRTHDSDVFFSLQSLHFDLLSADTGRRVNGAIAASLMLVALSGLRMWLRTPADWAARLIPRWRVRRARRNWGVHVGAGFWGVPFLLLMASTALYFAFHDPVAKLVYAVTGTSGPAPLPRSREVRSLAVSLDALVARVRALEPEASLTLIRLPRAAGQPVTLNYVLPGDLSDLGGNAIHFDSSTGAVLRVDRLRDMELGTRIVAAFVPLHFGTFGGLSSRVLWAGFGVLPSLLLITGVAIWRRRRRTHSTPEGAPSELCRIESVVEVRNQ